MKVRYLIFALVIFVIIVVGYLIYCLGYGNPISKGMFKEEVEEYLRKNYQDEMIIESIEYSFKESTSSDQHFIAVVHPMNNPNQIIRIDKGYDGNLQSYNVEN
ncbi:YfjL-like protein [Paenibacillus sp. MMO-58]|uniref:YfjL-like protein n=1 Tax=Paenibacillus sp. MMO-58 TaxID=3081290 RepID=UPI00301B6585